MRAARRWCLRAAVLVAMTSAAVSGLLQACQFPEYHVVVGATSGGGIGGGGNNTAGAGAPASAGTSGLGGSLHEGGAGDGGDGADGGGGADSEPCPVADCVAAPSGGWIGPIALWDERTGTPPDCPAGYGAPLDRYHGLNAPDGACKCTCTPEGQSCAEDTSLQIFTDMSCSSSCATVTAPGTCSATSGCTGSQGSMFAEIPTPSGGTCRATPSPIDEPTWDYSVRVCQLSSKRCEDPNQVCAPRRPPPFVTASCVMRIVQAGQEPPECPADFPHASPPFYERYDDGRGCTPCACSGVTGGECSGTLTLSSGGDCSSGASMALGSSCTRFDLGPGSSVQPRHVGAAYVLKPGTCSVTTAPKPMGSAVEIGSAVVVCCSGE